jgi:hypothetical protein
VNVLTWNGKVIDVEVPNSVILKARAAAQQAAQRWSRGVGGEGAMRARAPASHARSSRPHARPQVVETSSGDKGNTVSGACPAPVPAHAFRRR